MDQRFREHVDALRPLLEKLRKMKAVKVSNRRAGDVPDRGIYLLSEGRKYLYVGRSNDIHQRLARLPRRFTSQRRIIGVLACAGSIGLSAWRARRIDGSTQVSICLQTRQDTHPEHGGSLRRGERSDQTGSSRNLRRGHAPRALQRLRQSLAKFPGLSARQQPPS